MSGVPIRERASPNHAPRHNPARIDMLVLHYTGMRSAAAALERLCDPHARVSAHYVVEEDGAVWRLVCESRRAFHAGVSCWAGERDLNHVSIGVEIVNPGHEWGYRLYPKPQMLAVEELCRDILSRHPIPAHRVVGHSDIAPDRKIDPGELFDWPGLAHAGIGIWPVPRSVGSHSLFERNQALAALAAIGYCLAAETAAVAAFQRRFRPERIDGVIDCATAARLVEVRADFARSRSGVDNGFKG
jgi:N-acetylmuramoyl-L-alanine amidase